MGFIPIDCPICGRKIKSVNENMDASGNTVCSGCKNRIQYDYDHKTKHISTGRK